MLIGASLKMYFSHARTVEWATAVGEIVAQHPAGEQVEAFVIPQYPSIPACVEVGGPLAVGAQDVATADEGAYTGEVSGAVLAELGCTLVEVGHAERRRLFGETDEIVAEKVHAALRNGLVPLICVGESDRMPAAEAAVHVRAQIDQALSEAAAANVRGAFVVAYEPLWAIGAPEPAAPAHIRAVCRAVRDGLAGRDARIIYGGSAGPGLLTEIADSVDGLFLGRFAHDPAAVRAILDEVESLPA